MGWTINIGMQFSFIDKTEGNYYLLWLLIDWVYCALTRGTRAMYTHNPNHGDIDYRTVNIMIWKYCIRSAYITPTLETIKIVSPLPLNAFSFRISCIRQGKVVCAKLSILNCWYNFVNCDYLKPKLKVTTKHEVERFPEKIRPNMWKWALLE